jgi:prophage antirepressor-like protein
MSGEKEVEEEFGLNMSMDEALQRFGRVTKEEIEEEGRPGLPAKVPDGEFDLVPFKKEAIRRVCHNDEWWYSVVDVVTALSGSDRGRKYWSDLKKQIAEKEGFSELSDEIGQLPMPSADGKMRQTDVATAETILRIIQSISSPKAEPFKRWLARVGYERIQEAQDPEVLIKRAILHYSAQGRTDDWIEKRIRSMVARKELTAEWKKRGVNESKDFAMLSNVIAEETFGMGVERHKRMKGLKSQNLRDHMTDMELILTMLGETSTKEIAVKRDAHGLYENAQAARAGGNIAGGARRQIEAQTGQKVVSPQNFLGKRKDEQALPIGKSDR